MFIAGCNLLVNLYAHNNSLGGAEDKARKQVNEISSSCVQREKKKKPFHLRLFIDGLTGVCV